MSHEEHAIRLLESIDNRLKRIETDRSSDRNLNALRCHTLAASTERLRAAVAAAGGQHTLATLGMKMPNAALDALDAQIAATSTVIDSAVVLINGFGAIVAKAVADAVAGGATAAELATAVTDKLADIKAKTDALASAVAANTKP